MIAISMFSNKIDVHFLKICGFHEKLKQSSLFIFQKKPSGNEMNTVLNTLILKKDQSLKRLSIIKWRVVF